MKKLILLPLLMIIYLLLLGCACGLKSDGTTFDYNIEEEESEVDCCSGTMTGVAYQSTWGPSEDGRHWPLLEITEVDYSVIQENCCPSA